MSKKYNVAFLGTSTYWAGTAEYDPDGNITLNKPHAIFPWSTVATAAIGNLQSQMKHMEYVEKYVFDLKEGKTNKRVRIYGFDLAESTVNAMIGNQELIAENKSLREQVNMLTALNASLASKTDDSHVDSMKNRIKQDNEFHKDISKPAFVPAKPKEDKS